MTDLEIHQRSHSWPALLARTRPGASRDHRPPRSSSSAGTHRRNRTQYRERGRVLADHGYGSLADMDYRTLLRNVRARPGMSFLEAEFGYGQLTAFITGLDIGSQYSMPKSLIPGHGPVSTMSTYSGCNGRVDTTKTSSGSTSRRLRRASR